VIIGRARVPYEGVIVSGRRVAAHSVFWAAGVMASPAANWLKAEADRSGRVKRRLVGPRSDRHLRDRRYGSVQRLERQAGAGARAGSQAAGPLRRLSHQGFSLDASSLAPRVARASRRARMLWSGNSYELTQGRTAARKPRPDRADRHTASRRDSPVTCPRQRDEEDSCPLLFG
jgi:hypothetical protein